MFFSFIACGIHIVFKFIWIKMHNTLWNSHAAPNASNPFEWHCKEITNFNHSILYNKHDFINMNKVCLCHYVYFRLQMLKYANKKSRPETVSVLLSFYASTYKGHLSDLRKIFHLTSMCDMVSVNQISTFF